MAETIDELGIELWEEGEQVVKELKKHVLTRGAWATIMYLYQELDRKTKEFQEPKTRIVRYRKYKGSYRPHTKFNISSAKQAQDIIKVLEQWYPQQK